MTVTGVDHRYLAENIVQLLDEHHLAVLGDDVVARRAFESSLLGCLEGLPETELHIIRGGELDTLDGFCAQVEQLLDGAHVPRSIAGVIDVLRARPGAAKRRYVLWRDADDLLEADVELFGRLVNALLVVAAAHEHLLPDLLFVQRLVLVGGPKLGAYAEDVNGQFVRWLDDPEHALGEEVSKCVEHPGVLTYRIDG